MRSPREVSPESLDNDDDRNSEVGTIRYNVKVGKSCDMPIRLANSWSALPEHVKLSIETLVDAALLLDPVVLLPSRTNRVLSVSSSKKPTVMRFIRLLRDNIVVRILAFILLVFLLIWMKSALSPELLPDPVE